MRGRTNGPHAEYSARRSLTATPHSSSEARKRLIRWAFAAPACTLTGGHSAANVRPHVQRCPTLPTASGAVHTSMRSRGRLPRLAPSTSARQSPTRSGAHHRSRDAPGPRGLRHRPRRPGWHRGVPELHGRRLLLSGSPGPHLERDEGGPPHRPRASQRRHEARQGRRLHDLTGVLAANEGVTSALPDFKGNVWFVSKTVGKVGVLNTKTRDIGILKLGAASRSRTRFSYWKVTYGNSAIHKPGQVDAGTGPTPTIVASSCGSGQRSTPARAGRLGPGTPAAACSSATTTQGSR